MWGGFNASIDGEGFFITAPSKFGGTTGVNAADFKSYDFDYTRVGQFLLDSNGYVVDANGNFVYGFQSVAGDDGNGNREYTYKKELLPLRVPLVSGGAGGTLPDEKIEMDEAPESASTTVTIQVNNAGIVTATVKYTPDPAVADKYETRVVTVGKLAVATFQNPNGVSKSGGNYYKATNNDNTGPGIAAPPGDAGTATLMGGFIEASNVDLAKEFADMITTHRGFQANSKMITVSDEMLSDLVAMKR